MKSSIKHIFIFLFLLIGIYFVGIDRVSADINWYGVKIECIYTDGGAYSFSYIQNGVNDAGNNTYYSNINRITYNLLGVDYTKSATTSSIVYVSTPVSSDHKCLGWLKSGSVTEKDEDDTNNTTTYYKFASSEDGTNFESTDFPSSSWWDIWITGKKKTTTEKANEANTNGSTYSLVSERYILTELAGEPDYTLTYRESSEQATGSDSYAYIMVYGSTYLLKTSDRTTLLETGASHFDGISVDSNGNVSGLEDDDIIYINSPETLSTIDSTGINTNYFKYGQVRYEVSTSYGGNFTREFVLFNTGLESGDAPNTELCDSIMPETSKVLKKIIQIGQIMIPVLMIVLCGIDIGKIVLTGNIEEELPKQKKKIITRVVVGVLFFFLPLIVMLILNLVQDAGIIDEDSDWNEHIKSISCLFD